MKSPQFHGPVRSYFSGMGEAVADRTINRKLPDGGVETWSDVAYRVSLGNAMLCQDEDSRSYEFDRLVRHMRQASVLLSGRHLQHGDAQQPQRNQEVFTNCSTSAASFLLFYLLLNGSGVGRAYDDLMMAVDYRNMPIVVPVIGYDHMDVKSGEIKPMSERDARHFFMLRQVETFKVPDSREGWAQAIEMIETMAFKGQRDHVLLLDFSDVRPRGAPIKGMQNRPASGPGPLMEAIGKLANLRDANMPSWMSSMFADHYLAECVLVGGARRAARMATKWWRDKDIFMFINIKKGGFLWSSNNSVTVDKQFWDYVKLMQGYYAETPENQMRIETALGADFEIAHHAHRVFEAVCDANYHHRTGEPGFINVDKLASNMDGHEVLLDGDFAESEKFKLSDDAKSLMARLAASWAASPYKMITNPCGEITLIMLGGYCVIADVVPFHANMASSSHFQWDNEAEDAFRVTTRALMRVNLMDCLYKKEVRRTNRIGVGITGFHEYAWARFGYGWRDLVNEQASLPFWKILSRFKRAIVDEAKKYAAELGVAVPHTNTTMKPAGTTSKLFGLTEGAHLPSMREYLRWVQFRSDDPLIEQYKAKGYPVNSGLSTYGGTTIVGFPTQPMICSLGMGDKLVTAAEATPEEQYEFLRLLEKYWIRGVDEDGNPLPEESGNQVSYTLKYNPAVVSYEAFKKAMLEGQSTVRCCSVMPQIDTSTYEYQPEQPISRQQFDDLMRSIRDDHHHEEIGFEHVDCAGGACPIDWKQG